MSSGKKMKKSSVNVPVTPLRVPNDAAVARSSMSSQRNARPSSVAGRLSVLSISRRSSVQENKKELRLQIDRQSNHKNIKNLITLLTELGCPHQISMKNMTSPSTKDVLNIFQFLLSLLSITYPVGKKLEDEFPRILRLLRFPYNITKRQLQPIGSMHNWPTIVYALIWTCNLIKYQACLKNDPINLNTDTMDGLVKSVEMKFNQKAYRKFMEGVNLVDLDEVNEEFLEQLPSEVGLDELQQLDDKANELAIKEEELKAALEEQGILQQRASEMEVDSQKIQVYLNEMEIYRSNLEQTKLKLQQDNEELDRELGDIDAVIKQKEVIVATQRITVQEMHHLKAVLKSLDSEISDIEEGTSSVQNELLESDTVLLKEQKEVNVTVEEYHSAARNCKLIPISASNAQGFDYLLHLESANFSSDVDKIKCRLKVILQQWKEAAREIRAKEMKVLAEVQQLRAIQSVKNEDLSRVEAKLRRQLETKNVMEEEYATEMQKLRAELAEEEEKIEKLAKRDASTNDIKDLWRTIKELRTELQELEEHREKRTLEVTEFLCSLCELIVTHKSAIENKLMDFKEELANYCEQRKGMKLEFELVDLEEKMRFEELEHELDAMLLKVSKEGLNLLSTSQGHLL